MKDQSASLSLPSLTNLPDNVEELESSDVLHKEVDIIVVLECPDELHNERELRALKYFLLLHQVLLERLLYDLRFRNALQCVVVPF